MSMQLQIGRLHEDFLTVIDRFGPRTAHPDEVFHPIMRTKFHLKEALSVSRFFLSAADKMANALLKGSLSQFDPIVGENSCQARAVHAINCTNDPELQEEAKKIIALKKELFDKITRLESKPPSLPPDMAPEVIIEELQLSFPLSEKMAFCLRSFILTHGKFFAMNSKGEERSGIEVDLLRTRLSKQCDPKLIRMIVQVSQERLAQLTIPLIQSLAHHLPDGESGALEEIAIETIATPSGTRLQASCAFFNLKAIFLELFARGIPIAIINHSPKDPQCRLFFRSESPGAPPTLMSEPPSGNCPLFVIEGFTTHDPSALASLIESEGLLNMVLLNAATLPQFSLHDKQEKLPPAAQAEIAAFRAHKSPFAIFRIAHTHAASMRELGRELGGKS